MDLRTFNPKPKLDPLKKRKPQKKELIGRFASPGTIRCKKPIKVNDHDFPSYARFKAVPYGIFDLLNNRGTVGV